MGSGWTIPWSRRNGSSRMNTHAGLPQGSALPPPTVSMEEAAWLYDEFLRIVPCVEQQGVPVSPPPSKAAFVEQLTNQPIPKWHPYDAAPARAEELAHKCPITPWPGK